MKLTHEEVGEALARHYENEYKYASTGDEEEGYSRVALAEARGMAFAEAVKAVGGYIRSHSNASNPFKVGPAYINVGRLWREIARLMWRQVCEHDTGNAEAICKMTVGDLISLYVDTDMGASFTENGSEIVKTYPGGSNDPAKAQGIVEPDVRNEQDRRNVEVGYYPRVVTGDGYVLVDHPHLPNPST